ncbi:MAG: zinc ribbon domain-containing protein [Anaerolineae bacterium]
MPIYEYGCKSCGVTFEQFQRIADEPVAEFEYCPNHHEGCDIQRLISAPSLVKGMESTPTKTDAPPGSPAHHPAQSPEAIMADRAKGLQQQIQQRLQSFMRYTRDKGK